MVRRRKATFMAGPTNQREEHNTVREESRAEEGQEGRVGEAK